MHAYISTMPTHISVKYPHMHSSRKPSCQKVRRTFCLINPIELTRCRHLSYSVVGIVKTEKDFFSLKDSLQT